MFVADPKKALGELHLSCCACTCRTQDPCNEQKHFHRSVHAHAVSTAAAAAHGSSLFATSSAWSSYQEK